ncbi:AraC family transcriptional regulator [Maricurvus nonylphenolicus]|uniref:AraC family transcriptional regulator n=1 Tax=Maricurvus nonylphenolicus TaxID=1008307 RepID=UPI0036F2D8C3
MTQSSQQSSLSGWVQAIVRGLEDSGVDTQSLFRELGMEVEHLNGLDYRFDQEQVTRLWLRAEELSGDPNLGLKAAMHLRPQNLHAVGYAMSCSATVRDAWQRFVRFRHLLADSATLDLVEEADCYRLTLSIETLGLPAAASAYDLSMAGAVNLARWILDDNTVAPLSVGFSHAAPGDDSMFREFFACPVRFDQPQTEMRFTKSLLERSVPTANEELASVLDDLSAKYLGKRMEGSFAQQVRDCLITLLPKGEPSKAAVAEALQLNQRTLLRRLQSENTTYQAILDQLREEMAYGYLKRQDISLEEAAYLLGFSDVSTFSRAFRRWTGKSPGQWRSLSS